MIIDQKSNGKCSHAGVLLGLIPILAFTSCAPQTKPQDPHHVSLTRSYSNSFLWKQAKKDPAVFHPKDLPSGYAISQKTGEWVVDPKTRASFFVPNRASGGLSPEIWRKEANKAVDSLDKPEPGIPDEPTDGERVAIALATLPFEILMYNLFEDDDDEWFTERRRKKHRKDDCPPPDDKTPDDPPSDEEDKCEKPADDPSETKTG